MVPYPQFLMVFLAVMLTTAFGLPQKGGAAQPVAAPPLRINEFLADNDHVIHDEYGEYDDVIELYNAGQQAVDLSGMHLTDDLAKPTKFRIADGVALEPGKFLLFWADSTPAQGIYHTNFSLSKSSESIGIFDTDSNGNAPIDQYSFGPQTTDVSEGRCPDGGARWRVFTAPTLGASNGQCARLFLPLIEKNPSLGAPPALPLRIDCGSETPYTTAAGVSFVADRAWGENSSYGYVGGAKYTPTQWWEGNEVGGTDDDGLYKSQRLGWQEYRVTGIPNGDYLLTLSFEEQQAHSAGFDVFDVTVKGQKVLAGLDVFAEVGRYRVLDRRFAVRVADGELNVAATPIVGSSRLSALQLAPRGRDASAPALPSGLTATASYGAVLLDWTDKTEDDLAGYYVYRSERPDGPYTQLPKLTALSRYQDNVPTAHTPYYYRVGAVDVYGNASALTAPVTAAALATADATLPIYELQLSPENLAKLNTDPFTDDRVPGAFTYRGQTLTVEARYRGSTGRSLPKKSWKIKFPDASPFPGQDRINVNAYWLDNSLMHVRLATLVFEAAGLQPPQTENVLLTLNGEYMGVYTRAEEIDEHYLERTGRAPGATIYKVVDRFAELLSSEAEYRGYYEKETNKDLPYSDVIAFVELINKTPDSDFARTISQVMDVQRFLDYYAVMVLIADSDSARHNIYLVHDLATDKWELIPWDMEMAFYNSANAPIDMGTREHPWGPGRWNLLRTRILAVPEFRAHYCQRLATYMDTIFSDAAMHPQVDAVFKAIQSDVLRDWRKPDLEDNGPFLAAREGLKAEISQRKASLRQQMTTFCPSK